MTAADDYSWSSTPADEDRLIDLCLKGLCDWDGEVEQ